MKKKRIFGAFALILALSLLLMACTNSGTKSSSSSKTSGYVAPVATAGTLDVAIMLDSTQATTYWNIIKSSFEVQYPTIKLNFMQVTNGNFDQIMQVRLAAGNLPDVYTDNYEPTKYFPTYYDLSNEPWASKVVPGSKPAVSDSSGRLVQLPIDRGVSGISYNVDILKADGIDPDTQLKTFDQLVTACDTVVNKSNGGTKAFFIGGADNFPIGLIYSYLGSGMIEGGANGAANVAAYNKGTFDWTMWTPFCTQINHILTKDCNPDFLTAKNNDGYQAYAQGKAVFFWGTDFTSGILALNANLNFNFVPIPSYKASDTPYFVSDVRDAFGINKDSKLLDDARLFIDFEAQPANITADCSMSGFLPCLTGIPDPSFNMDRLNTFSSTPTIGYVAVDLMSNDTGNTMTKDGEEFGAGSITADQFTADMKASYLRTTASSS